jgi:hypothetical protein
MLDAPRFGHDNLVQFAESARERGPGEGGSLREERRKGGRGVTR